MRYLYTVELSNAIDQFEIKKLQQKGIRQIWFNRSELCRHLGISLNTLKRWERHRHFPTIELLDFCTGRYDIRKVEGFLETLMKSRA